MIAQKTLASTVCTEGVGLHSGASVQVVLRPAAVRTGIVFRRLDICRSAVVKASAANVVSTRLATTLGVGEVQVATVEHLMAAFSGFGVDNAYVDLSGPELPIMDGSAEPFVRLIESAGIEEQASPKRFLRVVREVSYTDGSAVSKLVPHDGFRVEYTMNYKHPFFATQRQHIAVDVSPDAFVRDISRARTFGFLEDMQALRAEGLARGGSLDNAIVIGEDGIMNDDGLRYEDEFVKHKVLDAIGDLYLCGGPIIGAFSGYLSGHRANNALLLRLLDDPGAFEAVTLESTAYGGA